jgi:hypothetical protein
MESRCLQIIYHVLYFASSGVSFSIENLHYVVNKYKICGGSVVHLLTVTWDTIHSYAIIHYDIELSK